LYPESDSVLIYRLWQSHIMRGRKRSDLSSLEGKSIGSFREALKSEVTTDVYQRRLALFLKWARLTADEFVAGAKKDPHRIQDLITSYMLVQKGRAVKREISASTLSNYRKPIRLLLEMNDVTSINWKRISRLMPSGRRFALDRAPTLEEIRLIIGRSDIRVQAIILVMLSGGIRLGAWDYLDWGHVEPIRVGRTVKAAKLRVYAGEPEEYTAFITPEAYGKLEEYIGYRSQCGEKITKGSPLVRDKWLAPTRGGPKGDVNNPKRLESNGVKRLLDDTFWRLRIRTERKRRHEFSIHSFRKYFKTRAEQVMKPINVETLMGHSTGVSDSYYRPTEKDLLDDYLRAVPLLTVSEVEEVRRESLAVEQKNSERLRQLEELVSGLVAAKGAQVLALRRRRKSGT